LDSIGVVTAELLHLLLHLGNVSISEFYLALAVHVAVAVEAVAVVVAPSALAKETHDPVVALRVVQVQQVRWHVPLNMQGHAV